MGLAHVKILKSDDAFAVVAGDATGAEGLPMDSAPRIAHPPQVFAGQSSMQREGVVGGYAKPVFSEKRSG